MGTFSGSFAWPYLFPFPQRPPGLIDAAFDELARRWRPILDTCEDNGINLCYEIHPSEDLHDGTSFERFYELVDRHPRCNILFDPSHFVLQQLDYLSYLDIYHERIRMFHVKDAEFRPDARSGVYGGYQGWVERPGRFRSLGDGQIDFKSIFSKLCQYDFNGWAVLEWECALKHPEDGAAEGADFIRNHIIRVAERPFDDFAGSGDCRVHFTLIAQSSYKQGRTSIDKPLRQTLMQSIGKPVFDGAGALLPVNRALNPVRTVRNIGPGPDVRDACHQGVVVGHHLQLVEKWRQKGK